MLRTISPKAIKIVVGFSLGAIVIFGGFYGYRKVTTKPVSTPVKSVTPSKTQKTTTVNFDGSYSGTSSVASGISAANVNVNGTKLTGTASYTGFGTKIPLIVTGSVQRGDSSSRKNGNIQGNFSGSGTLMGQKISVSGVFSGHIITTSMNISYSGTASGAGQSQTYPGQITLSKK